MTGKHNILIGLCTSRRPKMLSNCLASLKEQKIPENAFLTLAVVENSQIPEVKEVVEKFMPEFRYQLIYVHEPERGIPIARNRVIDKALEIKADWIAFIDDDEIADKDWIKNLLSEAKKYQADAIQGQVIPIYPEPKPFWVIDITNKPPNNGSTLTQGVTNNILLSKKLFKEWDLKFDEDMRFSGGEDIDYFSRAYKKGAKIIYSNLPKVNEEIPLSKCRYGYLFKRRIRIMTNKFKILKKQKSFLYSVFYLFPKAYIYFMKGIFYFLLIPFTIILGPDKFKKTTLKTGKNIAYTVGYIVSVFNYQPKPYRKIEGS